jgi:hypothetical protein
MVRNSEAASLTTRLENGASFWMGATITSLASTPGITLPGWNHRSGAPWNRPPRIRPFKRAMASVKPMHYEPIPEHQAVYDRLYATYRQLHNAFGGVSRKADLSSLMKELIRIKEEQAAMHQEQTLRTPVAVVTLPEPDLSNSPRTNRT